MSNLTLAKLLPVNSSQLPAQKHTYIGLDFGTSTTVVSLFGDGHSSEVVSPIQISQQYQSGAVIQDTRIPTCLAYSKKYDELYFGAGAYEARFNPLLELGKNVWFEFKTLLGEDVGPRYHNTVLDGKDGRLKLETAVDATAIFLGNIREEVEKEIEKKRLPKKIMWAVSVPASFEANQRKDLIEALNRAGIANIGESMLIDEPNAAFLSYVDQSARLAGQKPLVVPDGKPISVLVFDFGAGTCDISILQFQQDDFSGVKSKNVAISHYTEIGGKDIDKMIADKFVEELLPLESSTPQVSDIPMRVKERLSHQLLRIAEQVKIELCKQVMFHQTNSRNTDIDSLFSTFGISPEVKDHQNRIYQLPKVKLTYQDMTGIIKKFTTERSQKSIISPIKSALKSAGLKAKDIDYVLFVGGSSKNPWIQTAVKDYFPESDYLFPEDMQTLVSEGAAIHSYYFNGLNHKLINPITGPTINLRMSNGLMKVLVPSGTEIPFEGDEINDLRPQRENQEAIELPICLTSESHILQNLKIEPLGKRGFSLSDKISLKVKITADKTLHVAAKVSTGEAVVTQLNPYSSRALSTRERIAAEGRKRFNQAIRRNAGNPTASAFINLSEALKKAEQRKEAAEMMEEGYQIDKGRVDLNSLAVAWHNAGNITKAKEFYNLAIEQGDVYACANLANAIRWTEPEEYRKLLIKAFSMNPSNDWVLYNYGEMLKSENNEEWQKHWKTCLRIYLNRLNSKTLKKDDVDRALVISKALNEPQTTALINEYSSTISSENQVFNENNTVTSNSKQIVKNSSINPLIN
ncbi:Hsp70 family protein [Algoriphagus lutimaris]|uniref:Hsp70 family protein n=1 Tax=Algoriphagus lutimaris TaxID=613197 RepID=UPI00196ABA51|nr:Hsp70 family protein [Algoriphagus lutimaris]MBN3520715.1 Hsp70 family protein [Algoriphagus lutimaris]